MGMPRSEGRLIATGWRLTRTAIALLVLGGGALLIGIAGGLYTLLPRRDDQGLTVQRWLHRGVRGFMWTAGRLGQFRVEGDSGEALRAPGAKLVVANHPTGADVLVLMAFMPQLDCIVKQSWATHPVWGPASHAANYIVAEDGPGAVQEATRRLRAGRSVLVFPEGTRSPESGLGRFHRGAAHLALASGCDFVPVILTSSPPDAFKRGWHWWDLPSGGTTIDMRVGSPISPKASITGDETHSVAVRRMTAHLRGFYEERLGLGN
jgi:1-acyl-sn-glycerol-3-phosphate acyltransferase